jgi:hypothetical protein
MRFATSLHFGVIAVAVAVSAGPARPQDTDDSLRLYAVHISRTPLHHWSGNGVFLGGGIIITAAHIAASAMSKKPLVEIAGKNLSAEVLRQGDLNDVDLAILSIDESQLPVSLALRRMPPCQEPLWVGEPVIVATPEGVARSYIMSPQLLPPGVPDKLQTVIPYAPETGNSGSGVFAANKKCLLGIISQKISRDPIRQKNALEIGEMYDVAKYFVPASTIADFIPPGVRF